MMIYYWWYLECIATLLLIEDSTDETACSEKRILYTAEEGG